VGIGVSGGGLVPPALVNGWRRFSSTEGTLLRGYSALQRCVATFRHPCFAAIQPARHCAVVRRMRLTHASLRTASTSVCWRSPAHSTFIAVAERTRLTLGLALPVAALHPPWLRYEPAGTSMYRRSSQCDSPCGGFGTFPRFLMGGGEGDGAVQPRKLSIR
jgi:hypothetical protein